MKAFDTKHTNPIIARLICEIYLASRTWITIEQIKQALWVDHQGKQELRKAKEVSQYKDEYIISDMVGKFAWTLNNTSTGWGKYFDRSDISPYSYIPKEKCFDQLLQKLDPQNFAPTIDANELELRTNEFLEKVLVAPPKGYALPRFVSVQLSQSVYIKVYFRDPAVRAWILQQARGVCELCQTPGPFLLPNGLPYLEVHHVVPLAQNGPDTVENTVAVCPNCHRWLHYGVDASEKREQLYAKVNRLKQSE